MSTSDTPANAFASGEPLPDLKGRTIRGGVITMSSQVAQFIVSIVSTVVLARLLSPVDYGIVGMVIAVTGLLSIIKDSGLSMATIQRDRITRELISTVFWINMALGVVATVLCGILAPVLSAFYHEPRVYWITLAIASTFLIEAAGAQHTALLRRQMRLTAVATIDMVSNLVATGAGIIMATAGFGYWALVGMQISRTAIGTVAAWIVEPWRPGPPLRHAGARSMMRFGGYLAGVNLLGYSFRNADNVLIGWFWGAGSLGLYQKAYALLMLPISQVNAPIGGVAIAGLSRIQSDPERQRRFFVQGYSIATSIILPIVVAAMIFSDDVILLLLGEKWIAAARIFRLLAPAALIGALLNPLGWLFVSFGHTRRQFIASLIWTPLIILAFALGLPWGPEGVAIAYSAMSALLAIPTCFYGVRGTSVRVKDIVRSLKGPVIAAAIAGISGVALEASVLQGTAVSVRAIGGCLAVVCIYAFVLLVILQQWAFYRDLVRHLFPRRFSRNGEEPAASERRAP